MRYYENIYPKEQELVMVQISSVTDDRVYVHLLEYDNIEGMISSSEMTNRRFNHSKTRVGRVEVAMVLSVDEEKGYIDLSKKKVSAEDVITCQTRWNKAKWVHSLMSRVAELCSEDPDLSDWTLLRLSQHITWPLYPRAYEVLREGNIQSDLDEKLTQLLKENIRKRMTINVIKLRADIDVICYRYDGIDSIKEALLCGLSVANEEELSIMLDKSPTYMVTLKTIDKQRGIELLHQVCEAIVGKIEKLGGYAVIQREPSEVSEEAQQ